MSREKSWPVSISERVPEVRQLKENCHWRAEPLSCWELSLCHTCPWILPSHTSQGCLDEKGSQTHIVSLQHRLLCTLTYTPNEFQKRFTLHSSAILLQWCNNSVVLYVVDFFEEWSIWQYLLKFGISLWLSLIKKRLHKILNCLFMINRKTGNFSEFQTRASI